MTLSELQQRIEAREATLAVIGLGYVGLAVAAAFAEAGFRVIGVEIQANRVEQINAGQNPMVGDEPGLDDLLKKVVQSGGLRATTDHAELRAADVILICVETPVDHERHPHYEALRSACQHAGSMMKPGALVVVESTVAPGTTQRVVRPWLEAASGRKVNAGFFLGHCPERVMPGKLLSNLRHLSRVCGGYSPETSIAMTTLYRHVVQGDLDAADCVTAETVKTAENAYRDVGIAFANELALVCETTGSDFLRVRELVNKSPGRNVLLAGGGVGGHCIPKDPWLLLYGAGGQTPLRLISAARAVNDAMPRHVTELVSSALKACGRELAEARVAVLGYAYLENTDDIRNSPSITLINHLNNAGATVVIHDPYVPEFRGEVMKCLRDCDAMVVMVAHAAYREMNLAVCRAALRLPLLVDARRVFSPAQVQAAGLRYYAVGWGAG